MWNRKNTNAAKKKIVGLYSKCLFSEVLGIHGGIVKEVEVCGEGRRVGEAIGRAMVR